MLQHTGRFLTLPEPRTALIGREHDLAMLRDMLHEPETRLLTLSGVGGCGKTRLALQLTRDLAADYRDRTWVVELAASHDPELIPTVVAQALGLQESGPASLPVALARFLGPAPALLVLDNCEHLVDACAMFVDTLLASCPELRVIVTSREPLHIPGERQYRVPPLDIPATQDLDEVAAVAASPAVQLFVTRAQAVLPAFELTPDNASVVARICVRLEGIPLALELAAARVHLLGLEELLARLSDAFQLLIGGSRVAPTRHQTLRATLAWSDNLLTASERTVFRRLAVFGGEFRLDAVEDVCTDDEITPEAVLDLVSGLADKSLIVSAAGEQTATYRLLVPVRQYALDLLEARDEAAAMRSRHAAFYLALAERAATELRGPDQAQWRDRLEFERDNLRAALEWARETEPVIELRLALALAPFWEIHGQISESLQRLQGALERSKQTVAPRLRMRALAVISLEQHYVDQLAGRPASTADQFGQESLTLARQLGDAPAEAAALSNLGMIYREWGDYPRAIDCLEQALSTLIGMDDEAGTARTLLQLGLTIYRAEQSPGDRARAIPMFEEGLKRLSALGDLRSVGMVKVMLGQTARDRGDIATAARHIAEGMSDHLSLNDLVLVTLDLFALGEVLLDAGKFQHAVRFVGAAQALAERMDMAGEQALFVNIADVSRRVDELQHEQWFEAEWAAGSAWDAADATAAAHGLVETLDEPDQPTVPEIPGQGPLTPREVEVAGYLAEGFSDRQIAEALFIAQSTVGTHVHHILQKLDLKSRVQVADWLAAQPEQHGDSA